MRALWICALFVSACGRPDAVPRPEGEATFEALGNGRFLGRGAGIMRLGPGRIEYAGSALHFPEVAPHGERPLGVAVHRFHGTRAQSSELCGAVRYRAWPGIDLLVHSRGRQFEIDLELDAGADWENAVLRVEGGEPRCNADGDLEVGGLRMRRPVVLQGGKARDGWYRIERDGVRFGCDTVDRARPCVIDPVLGEVFVDGGENTDLPHAIAVGPGGDLYVCGQTVSAAWSGGNTLSGGYDAFVARYAPTGNLKAIAYLGGTGSDAANDIEVDALGRVYLTGSAHRGFPLTVIGTPTVPSTFVAVLDSDLASLRFSRYLPGTSGNGLRVAGDGSIHIAGTALGTRPALGGVNPDAPGGTSDAFYLVVDQNGVHYQTYLGDTGSDEGVDVDLDAAGHAWIIGSTEGSSLPRIGPGGGVDVAVWQIDPGAIGAASLLSATALGGRGFEEPVAIVRLPGDRFALGGSTVPDEFPLLRSWDPRLTGSQAGFAAVLEADGTTLYYSALYANGRAAGLDAGPDGILSAVVSTQVDPQLGGGILARIDPATTGRWSLVEVLDATDSLPVSPVDVARAPQTSWVLGNFAGASFDLGVARVEDGPVPQFADLELTAGVTHNSGRTRSTITLKLRNLGRDRAENVRVESDELPPGVSVSDGDLGTIDGRLFWDVAAIDGATGESEATARVEVRVDPDQLVGAPRIRLRVVTSSMTDPEPANDRVSVPLHYQADLHLRIVADRQKSEDRWKFKLTLENRGPDRAHDVEIRGVRVVVAENTYPALATAFGSLLGTDWFVDEGRFTVDRIDAGDTFRYQWTFPKSVPRNTAVEVTAGASTLDPEPADNTFNAVFRQPLAPVTAGGCFIATAAYGSPLEDDVATLRRFRDEHLLTNAPGRAAVEFYYEHSPPAADVIAERPWLRGVTRFGLGMVVAVIRWPWAAAALALLAWRRRRWRWACLLPLLTVGLLAI
ncbi:MAG: CFI-box-CTERM domain-containing protein [Planctomycetota bacterium]